MKEDLKYGYEEGAVVKQLTIADQQLIAEFHQLPNDNQKLVKAYVHGLLKASGSFGNQAGEN
ncbi:hypothetical protein C823_005450 [Eubacterium plexicaudatum ASF492]|uniref:Uncharacterized protein n=1 Tax=Eubacterium plexicaudatum ASF492 TaxID=1235802 RepID=N2B0T9_9FIRM|nr:hypothetical protein C823_005450 [Eubacterium plexicaudatum ASF492]